MDAKNTKSPLLAMWLVGAVLGLFVALALTRHAPGISFPSDRIPSDAKSDFGLMAEAWNAIQSHYVERSAGPDQNGTGRKGRNGSAHSDGGARERRNGQRRGDCFWRPAGRGAGTPGGGDHFRNRKGP